MEYKKPQFRSVDFELFSSQAPAYLLRHFDRMGLSILYADKNYFEPEYEYGNSTYLISVEINSSVLCERILEDFLALIAALSGKAKKDWENREGLILNLAYTLCEEQHASHMDLPRSLLKQAQSLEASIQITTYNESEVEWDDDHVEEQIALQAELDRIKPCIESADAQVKRVKDQFGEIFEQAHSILKQVDPLNIQEDYAFETSSLLEMLESEGVHSPEDVAMMVESGFKKWALFPDIEKKCETVSSQMCALWAENKSMFAVSCTSQSP